jgi:hypothetical protein
MFIVKYALRPKKQLSPVFSVRYEIMLKKKLSTDRAWCHIFDGTQYAFFVTSETGLFSLYVYRIQRKENRLPV